MCNLKEETKVHNACNSRISGLKNCLYLCTSNNCLKGSSSNQTKTSHVSTRKKPSSICHVGGRGAPMGSVPPHPQVGKLTGLKLVVSEDRIPIGTLSSTTLHYSFFKELPKRDGQTSYQNFSFKQQTHNTCTYTISRKSMVVWLHV